MPKHEVAVWRVAFIIGQVVDHVTGFLTFRVNDDTFGCPNIKKYT